VSFGGVHLRWAAEVEPLQPPQSAVRFKLRAPPAVAREMASAGPLMHRGQPYEQPTNRRRGSSPHQWDRWTPGPSAPPILEPLPAAAASSQRTPYIVGTEGPGNDYSRSRSPPTRTGHLEYTGHVGYTSRNTSAHRSRKSSTVCIHWSNFRCYKGDNCPFQHTGPGANKEAPRGYFDGPPRPRR
jgi:hypothetical protein